MVRHPYGTVDCALGTWCPEMSSPFCRGGAKGTHSVLGLPEEEEAGWQATTREPVNAEA